MSTGLMYTCEFDLIPESSDDYFFWFPEIIYDKVDVFNGDKINYVAIRNEFYNRFLNLNSSFDFSKIDIDNIETIEDICVSVLDPFGDYRFGHLHDTFQKIFSNRDYFQNQNCILLKSDSSNIRDFSYYIQQLGVNFKDHITFQKNKEHHIVFCKKVYLPLCPTYTTYHSIKYYNEFIIGSLLKSVSSSLLNINQADKKPVKIFLSRQGFSRTPLGEEWFIKEVLIPSGWTILYGNEKIEDVIWLFSNADKVLGTHGASFANTLFCKESCLIIELCCKNRPVYSLKEKYKRARNYSQILVDCDAEYVFSVDIFKQFL
jgi:hypothetical protein